MSVATATSRSTEFHHSTAPISPAAPCPKQNALRPLSCKGVSDEVSGKDKDIGLPTLSHSNSKQRKSRNRPERISINDLADSSNMPSVPPLRTQSVVTGANEADSVSARILAAQKSLERATLAHTAPLRASSRSDHLSLDIKGKGKDESTWLSSLDTLHRPSDDGSESSDSVRTELGQRPGADSSVMVTSEAGEGEQTPVYARSPPKIRTLALCDHAEEDERGDDDLGLLGMARTGLSDGDESRSETQCDVADDVNDQRRSSTTDISRTPSQSTTGTHDSSNIGSLDTAASSLQSSSSAVLQDPKTLRRSSSEGDTEPSSVLMTTEVSVKSDDEGKEEAHGILVIDDGKNIMSLRRYHALLELVETEYGYAEDLQTLVNVFFANLTSQPYFLEDAARVDDVVRNASELLDLHVKLARQLNRIMQDCGLSNDSEGSDVEKGSDRSEAAVKRIAQRLQKLVSRFEVYKSFCVRNEEANAVIKEAERRHNGEDFATFERLCGHLVRSGVHFPPSVSDMSSRNGSRPTSPSPPSIDNDVSGSTTSPTSSLFFHGEVPTNLGRRNNAIRLRFADYLIKPVQRLCRYPLLLDTILKYTPADELATRHALEEASASMKKVADDVEEAIKQRRSVMISDLIVTRVEPQQAITQTYLRSLGIPMLSGTVDVLHHSETFKPLSSSLRFEHRGIVLWSGWLLFVKVRKSLQLEPRFWFPLADAKLSRPDDADASFAWPLSSHHQQPVVRHALRLTYGKIHHFELSFSSAKELDLWSRTLSIEIKQAKEADPREASYPSNLSNYDDGRQVAIRRALERGPPSENKAGSASTTLVPSADEVLNSFFASHAGANTTSDSLVKFWGVQAKDQTKLNMVFTDTVVDAIASVRDDDTIHSGEGVTSLLLARDLSEQVVSQQMRQSAGLASPSFGAAVGAAMDRARKTASAGMEGAKRVRRQSSGLLIYTGNLPSSSMTVETVESPTDVTSQASSGTTSRRDSGSSTWKASMMRLGTPKMRPLSVYIPADGAGGAQRSLPVSPSTSTAESPRINTKGLPVISRSTDASPRAGQTRSMSMAVRDVWAQTSRSAAMIRARSNSANSALPVEIHTWEAQTPAVSGKSSGTGTSRPMRGIRSRTSSIIGIIPQPQSMSMEPSHSSNTNSTLSSQASTRSCYASAQSSRAPSPEMARDSEDSEVVKRGSWSSTLRRARTSIPRAWAAAKSDNSDADRAEIPSREQHEAVEATESKSRAKIERSATEMQISRKSKKSAETRRGSFPSALSSASSSTSSLSQGVNKGKNSSPALSVFASSSTAAPNEGFSLKRRLSSRFLQQVRLTPSPSTTCPPTVTAFTASSSGEMATVLNPVEETSVEYSQLSPPIADADGRPSQTTAAAEHDSYFSPSWSLKQRATPRPGLLGRRSGSASPLASSPSTVTTSTTTTNAMSK